MLGAARTFPKLIKSDALMSEGMAKAVCSEISRNIIRSVPQLDDFMCPICFAVVWRPIRLKCRHVLCIGCTVQLQKQQKQLCPLCRERVIMEADTGKLQMNVLVFSFDAT